MKKIIGIIVLALFVSCTNRPIYMRYVQIDVKHYHVNVINDIKYVFIIFEGEEYHFEIIEDRSGVPSLFLIRDVNLRKGTDREKISYDVKEFKVVKDKLIKVFGEQKPKPIEL